jgi:four helix bundle protein
MSNDLKDRSKPLCFESIKLVNSLPKTLAAQTVGRQLIRSGTSVAANYRAACRTRSKADFIAKMGIVEEETDESAFWIGLLVDAEILERTKVADLWNEANELTAIWVSSINTARGHKALVSHSAFCSPH